MSVYKKKESDISICNIYRYEFKFYHVNINIYEICFVNIYISIEFSFFFCVFIDHDRST